MVCVNVGILMRPSERPMDGAPPSGVAGDMGDSGKVPERGMKANTLMPPPPKMPKLQRDDKGAPIRRESVAPQQHQPPPPRREVVDELRPSTSRPPKIVLSENLLRFSDKNAFKVDARKLASYVEKKKYPYVGDINEYEKITKIGQGTFGEVHKARDKRNNRVVALKKILTENEKEGFPITALREVKQLRSIRHENVIELIEVCAQRTWHGSRCRVNFYLVFPFCDHDLAGILSDNRIELKQIHMKCIMHQLLSGLEKLHKMRLVHRDMKAANLLLTNDGCLKLADFGLSRQLTSQKRRDGLPPLYTNRVVTLWYRPPELLLGERSYGSAIDVWGAGCVMGELWTRRPFMQGETEQMQLSLISALCGPINEISFPGCSRLSKYKEFKDTSALPQDVAQPRLRSGMSSKGMKNDALKLFEKLLTIDPKRRISATDALNSDFFYDYDPATGRAALRELLSRVRSSHFEMTSARFRQQQQQQQHHPRPPRPQPPPDKSGQYHDRIF